MLKRFLVTTVLLLVTATGASAQWDAPTFFAPRAMDDIGLYYFKAGEIFDEFDLGDTNGLKLIWRQSGNLNLGVHVGTADLDAPSELILVGAELYGPLTSLTASTGLVMNWSAGIGGTFGNLDNDIDYIAFTVPVGVSIGLRLGSGGVAIVPYIHPRVSLDATAITVGDAEEETQTDVGFSVDVGADLDLGDRFILRGGVSLGDREAFGIGLALRIPRKVVVR